MKKKEIRKRIDELSPVQRDLLVSCLMALKFVDDSLVKPLPVDIEEDCAPTRETIEIINSSISYVIKVNGRDVTDKGIDW
jgi:hypothetical protein